MKTHPLVSLPALIAVVVLVIVWKPLSALGEEAGGSKIRIGVGDDVSRVLFEYLIEENAMAELSISRDFETYSVKDCCTSNAQWALSGDMIDVAALCPTAAKVLIEKDQRYEIAGPLIMDGDVFVLRNNHPTRIGVGQNREHLYSNVRQRYGEQCEIVPMVSSALPYALEQGKVDAILTDVLKGIQLKGQMLPPSENEQSVTSVLVVRKQFRQNPKFEELVDAINDAAGELNQPEIVEEYLKSATFLSFESEEVKKWQILATRFLYITKAAE